MNKLEHNQNEEMSIWDLLKLISKNWLNIVLITSIAIAISAVYSFVFQTQEVVHYGFNELVLYDEWNYYPPAINQSYTKALNEYITGETGESYFSTLVMRDTNGYDNKSEYKLQVSYFPSVDEGKAQELTQMIIDWHNIMIDDEFIKTLCNKEQITEQLFVDYTTVQLEYETYIVDHESHENTVSEECITLLAKQAVAYELLMDAELELKNIYEDQLSINSFYVSEFDIKPSVNSTWKSNLIIAFIAGVFLSLIFILAKESYNVYKNKNIKS